MSAQMTASKVWSGWPLNRTEVVDQANDLGQHANLAALHIVDESTIDRWSRSVAKVREVVAGGPATIRFPGLRT